MDMRDVKGQEHVKRGLEVAASGNHSILMIGPPNSGKLMLARRLKTITDMNIKIFEMKKIGVKEAIQIALDFIGIIVITMSPCPCGHFTDPKKECHCTPYQIQRYLGKISGALLDKIDIHLNVPKLDYEELSDRRRGESSKIIAERIDHIRDLPPSEAEMDKDAEELLKMAILELGISARAYDKILAIAKTISIMENKKDIEASHISEAISYRSLDRDFWMV